MANGMGRGGLQGLIIMLLFFGPIVAAFMLYFTPNPMKPTGSTAHGQLLDPIRTLPAFRLTTTAGEVLDSEWLERKWWLVYFSPQACEVRCLADLDNLRKVRLLLNQDRDRVGYTLISQAPSPTDDDLLVTGWPVGANAGEAEALLRQLSGDDQPLFIVDPHRNLVMRYPIATEPDGLLKDLKRLLRLSSIG